MVTLAYCSVVIYLWVQQMIENQKDNELEKNTKKDHASEKIKRKKGKTQILPKKEIPKRMFALVLGRKIL